MSDALRTHVPSRRPQATPQGEPAREDQVKNNAGGFTFAVSDHVQVHRFLTIGTTGGTYHVSEKELTRENAGVVTALAERSDPYLVDQAAAVSVAGRAPSNDPALFALAAAAGLGDVQYRRRAFDLLPRVARTGTHLLTFIAYAELFRGWGPQMVRGVQNWYLSQEPEALAYQLLKYQSRGKWSQRDVLRLCGRKWKFRELSEEHKALLAYVMNGRDGENLPALVHTVAGAHFVMKTAGEARRTAEWVRLIEGNRSLSHEMLPSEALAEPAVWRAMVENGNVPQTALIRNLARLTTLGVLRQGDSFTRAVAERLADPERLRKARVHPITLLLALKTYAQGHGTRGKGTWHPVPAVTDALDAAFYAAFPAVEPAGNRVCVSVDISGTMSQSAGGLPVTCREVAAAMSLVTVATEPQASVYGFGHSYQPLDISPRRRLDDTARYMASLGMQRTDCSLPMMEALREGREVDTFVVLTDNETWYGGIHPHQALERYRQSTGIDARLQVAAFVPTRFSIADPLDPKQLDVSGFDATVPQLLADHGRGDL